MEQNLSIEKVEDVFSKCFLKVNEYLIIWIENVIVDNE